MKLVCRIASVAMLGVLLGAAHRTAPLTPIEIRRIPHQPNARCMPGRQELARAYWRKYNLEQQFKLPGYWTIPPPLESWQVVNQVNERKARIEAMLKKARMADSQ